MVLAGAGTGKTRAIVERIRYLIQKGVDPSKILAITFTNKAAGEMHRRINRELDNNPSRPFISTFHALGVHILREQSEKAGIKRHFSVYDRNDSKGTIKEALLTLGLDPKTYETGRLISIISIEKGRGKSAQDYLEESGRGHLEEIIRQTWPIYEKILERDNALDFDDLLLKTMNLLKNSSTVREHYQKTWEYIHIDEYHDTNLVQYEISKMLSGSTKNICAVGDIDQNIYSWRGADIRNILNFEKDYPEAEVILLEKNYRSSKNILDTANAVIANNKIRREKKLFTENENGESVTIFRGVDEIREAGFVADKVKSLMEDGTKPEEIAVLYRANFQSRVLEEAFLGRSLPYQLIGTRFFERKEVKDVISYLRTALNPDNLMDIRRVINVPRRGIGEATISKIFSGKENALPLSMKNKLGDFRKTLSTIEKASKEKKPSETIISIIKNTGLEDMWKSEGEEGLGRLENAFELANFASRYDNLPPEEGILGFLADVALQSDQDEMRDDNKAVRLMTVHASKGLEFDVVFIIGLEDGLFPHEKMSNTSDSSEKMEEERRLFYVAVTRARKKVFLTYAETRFLFGGRQVGMPSRFVSEVPKELLEEETLNSDDNYYKPLLDIDF